ncbi:amidase domain-containing protein [Aquibacillus sediminis]|uniref:amidase domain-containing protein n=1 Tax=Aquibacillus sediminis TaxID=2574734 RepID=UPI00110851F7|nr:amidase domain-containing protein [Aquibacillus sediminis]
MMIGEQIKQYWQEQLTEQREEPNANWVLNKKSIHEKRGNKVPRMTGKGKLFRSYQVDEDKTKVEYNLAVTFFIKQGKRFYHEEEEHVHRALFHGNQLVEDEEVKMVQSEKAVPTIEPLAKHADRNTRFEYDRHAAVQYAERWWNDYNPEYKQFDVDCTNFVSQCLRAGGAPMRGAPNKGEGWWYQSNSWSYSWAVAHSLRWYLSGSNQGLEGKEVEDPTELLPGDVICYDFEGDGRWDHNTIVVEKDGDGMPLVNAHTDNSRHRYWSYEDSRAWTSDCKYKLFRIGD